MSKINTKRKETPSKIRSLRYYFQKTKTPNTAIDWVFKLTLKCQSSPDFQLMIQSFIVLGEKLNRLAYLEVVDEGHTIKYNNYSPDLPAWPFAVNVTYGMYL